MGRCHVRYSKGQLKIQEMAFVLVAIMIFISVAGLFFLNFWVSSMKGSTNLQRDDKASEIALKMADSPEFGWSSDNNKCDNCIDLDKAMALKINASRYKDLWSSDIGIIQIKTIYPKKTGECTKSNYPDSATITIINKTGDYSYKAAYVALCRQDQSVNGLKCELGQMLISAKSVK